MICCMSAKHMEFAPRGSADVQMRMAMAFCLNSWLSGYERLLLLGACEKLPQVLVSRIMNVSGFRKRSRKTGKQCMASFVIFNK